MMAPAGRPVLVAWRANAEAATIEVAFADRFLSSIGRDAIRWRLADADSQRIAGETEGLPAGTVDRVIGGGSSWLLRAWPDPVAPVPGRQVSSC
ncbi:MAG: hypothetical protein H0V80_01250 [Acidobacteria bacterium]|nr:hypothetical protein [Acidobacteriota bacterium]